MEKMQIDQRAVLERLCEQRREGYTNLSRVIGRNSTYIQQFIKRGSPKKLSEDDRRKLATYFGVDERELGGPSMALMTDDGNALVLIPRFDIGASAGPGSFGRDEIVTAHIGFERKWLKQFSASGAENLSIIRVEGDSMYPTLADGDDIMVDRSDVRSRLHEGIYVLRRDDTLVVKRLAVHPATKRVTISSDNAAYPSWPDCAPSDINVIGRVVWTGRKIS